MSEREFCAVFYSIDPESTAFRQDKAEECGVNLGMRVEFEKILEVFFLNY